MTPALLLSIAFGTVGPDNKVDFVKDIQPIFKSRCYECHGPKKQKGRMRLDIRQNVFTPTRGEPSVVPGKPEASLLYELVSLEADDPDIMPNEGDPLTKEQVDLLNRWIAEGATWPDSHAVPTAVEDDDDGLGMRTLSDAQKAAEAKALEGLAGRGALAMRVAADTNVVDVDFSFIGKELKDGDAKLLAGLEPTLVWLNFARTGVTDAALGDIGRYTELRRLNLSNTEITDAGLAHLKNLKHLEYLNLYGTKITDAGLAHLQGLSQLRNLYVWQTGVTAAGAETFSAAVANVSVDRSNYVLAPPAPTPVNAKCPITGKPAKPEFLVTVEGQGIAFCCNNCKGKFEKDSAPFLTKIDGFKAKAPAAAAKIVNKKCPVSGRDVDPKFFVTVDEQAVGFCCGNCKGKFEKDSAPFLTKIDGFKAKAPTD